MITLGFSLLWLMEVIRGYAAFGLLLLLPALVLALLWKFVSSPKGDFVTVSMPRSAADRFVLGAVASLVLLISFGLFWMATTRQESMWLVVFCLNGMGSHLDIR